MSADRPRECRVCGCTDADCRGCVKRTGEPCHWIEADLCSACELMRNDIDCITIYQPWSELIAAGLKPWEFRGWAAPARLIGKRIGIHAAGRPMRRSEVQELMSKLEGGRWRETGIVDQAKAIDILDRVWRAFQPGGRNDSLPTSHVVCTALLGEPIRNEQLAEALGVKFVNDSDRDEHSNFGWPLSEVERLIPPRPATGKQGFWRWAR